MNVSSVLLYELKIIFYNSSDHRQDSFVTNIKRNTTGSQSVRANTVLWLWKVFLIRLKIYFLAVVLFNFMCMNVFLLFTT